AAGSGVDHLAVQAAQAAGIVVTHAVGAGALSVAEHAVALMLALAKRLVEMDAQVRQGGFQEWRRPDLYEEISGRTLAVVGFGAIGRELARIAHRGFMMDVIAVTRDGRPVESPDVARTLPLAAALAEADVVSIHTPLTEGTRGLIGAAQFATMKRGAWLVDTSRGGVVDGTALHAALVSGHLGGAGLDVYDPEPAPVTHPLLALPQGVLSPHNAGISQGAYRRLALMGADDILRTLRGEKPVGFIGSDELWAASRAARG
ncbi:MAG: hypothetical protein IT514_16410, partial [Burkholderiales bacterium]|nr:hypothetical protein [Burkholderiales bacterium]